MAVVVYVSREVSRFIPFSRNLSRWPVATGIPPECYVFATSRFNKLTRNKY